MKIFYKHLLVCVSIIGLLALNGCATIFGDKTQTLNFKADKASKIILSDGKGTNKYDVPGAITITKDTEQVKFRVDCANAYEQKIPRNVKGVFWLNLFSGGVLGSGIDYLTGNMWQYDSDIQVPSNSCK